MKRVSQKTGILSMKKKRSNKSDTWSKRYEKCMRRVEGFRQVNRVQYQWMRCAIVDSSDLCWRCDRIKKNALWWTSNWHIAFYLNIKSFARRNVIADISLSFHVYLPVCVCVFLYWFLTTKSIRPHWFDIQLNDRTIAHSNWLTFDPTTKQKYL